MDLQKKRLIELLSGHSIDTPDDVEYVADILLSNGANLPPVTIGQTVYSLEKGISQVFIGKVYETCIRREGVVFRASRQGYYTLAFTEENIGKDVFFTDEEAQKALKEREA